MEKIKEHRDKIFRHAIEHTTGLSNDIVSIRQLHLGQSDIALKELKSLLSNKIQELITILDAIEYTMIEFYYKEDEEDDQQ